ncbi:tellurite resistance TerB family protein [Gelidibacter pelagius]|uniref:TerB family tellurite resistance protein n=1 Tax=Gelidibacter pelagius TaxID=2819985 RepID=A0ABS3STZ9_9FLAO|nr:TerB family tellurite resistance protein [Gelidibacter pelagius]MBO3099193.1 TerB family tellurite resistance protein [Gelidibacter pelagius]
MSISDLFDSGFKKRNEDHFASIVRLAMDDGVITDDEKAFLDRLAHSLDISEGEYKNILKNYQSHPINPPTSYDRRLERLFDLARMVHVDHIQGDGEEVLLKKIAIGLGFRTHNVKYIVDKALTLVANGVDIDTFIDEMKNMNR